MSPQSSWTAPKVAVAIRRELERGDQDFAFRLLAAAIADLRRIKEEEIAEFLTDPPSTGSIRWDTLLALAVGSECERRCVERPRWTRPLPLEREWVATALSEPSEAWVARVKARTPLEYSKLGLWFDPRNLDSA